MTTPVVRIRFGSTLSEKMRVEPVENDRFYSLTRRLFLTTLSKDVSSGSCLLPRDPKEYDPASQVNKVKKNYREHIFQVAFISDFESTLKTCSGRRSILQYCNKMMSSKNTKLLWLWYKEEVRFSYNTKRYFC
jgi:hypothetical protein